MTRTFTTLILVLSTLFPFVACDGGTSEIPLEEDLTDTTDTVSADTSSEDTGNWYDDYISFGDTQSPSCPEGWLTREAMLLRLVEFITTHQYVSQYMNVESCPAVELPQDITPGTELAQAYACCTEWDCLPAILRDGFFDGEEILPRGEVMHVIRHLFLIDQGILQNLEGWPFFDYDLDEALYIPAAWELLQANLLDPEVATGILDPLGNADICFLDRMLSENTNGNEWENVLEDHPADPEVYLTRGEAANRLYLFFPEYQCTPTSTPSFIDLDVGSEYYEAVECLAAAGVLQGLPQNEYRPENHLLRVEFMKIFHRASGQDTLEANFDFVCVMMDSWYYEFVMSSFHHGWLRPRLIFRPADGATQAFQENLFLEFDRRNPNP